MVQAFNQPLAFFQIKLNLIHNGYFLLNLRKHFCDHVLNVVFPSHFRLDQVRTDFQSLTQHWMGTLTYAYGNNY